MKNQIKINNSMLMTLLDVFDCFLHLILSHGVETS